MSFDSPVLLVFELYRNAVVFVFDDFFLRSDGVQRLSFTSVFFGDLVEVHEFL